MLHLVASTFMLNSEDHVKKQGAKMAATSKLRKLNMSTDSISVNQAVERWSAPGWIAGIPRGAVIEILGSHAAEWFIEFLKLHPELGVFWADKTHQAISLRRVMQTQMFEVLLAPNKYSDVKTLQALQIFAEKSKTTLFLFSIDGRRTTLPITLQLEITKTAHDHYRLHSLVAEETYGLCEL